jgi:hypothetical protein
MKKSILILLLMGGILVDGFSFIRITVTRSNGRGLDGYEFVFENFMRDPQNAANCTFHLNCTGNASTQCQFVNLDPFNTQGCAWITFSGGGGGTGTTGVREVIMDLVFDQVSNGNNSGSIIPSNLLYNINGTSEGVFIRFDNNVNGSDETTDILVYSMSEAIALGLVH